MIFVMLGGTDGLYKRPSLLWATGSEWGSSKFANSIAFGDIDGDGKDEFGFTLMTDEGFRFRILDDDSAGFQELLSDNSRFAHLQSSKIDCKLGA